MDYEQQQLLLKRLADHKTPQKTVKRILYALESKDRIIDSLTTRAQEADEIQRQYNDLKNVVEEKIKESNTLAMQLQQKQEHVVYLERLVEYLEQQTNCRTRQLNIIQQQQINTKQHMESKQKEEMEDCLSCVARMKYELASVKVDCLSTEWRNSELEEQIQLLSEDKAQLIKYYEGRVKQLEEDLKKQQDINESQLNEFQQKLEAKERKIVELENSTKNLKQTIEQLSVARNSSGSPHPSPGICRTSQEPETWSTLPHSEPLESVETGSTASERSRVKKRKKKVSKSGTTSPLNRVASEMEEESLRLDEPTQQEENETEDSFKENQGSVHNCLQTDEAVSELHNNKNDTKKRGAHRTVKDTKSSKAAIEPPPENIQNKRKKKAAAEKKSASLVKDSSFGLYSVGNDVPYGNSSLVSSSTVSNSALTSFRIPQLAFSMTKDGKVVFDAFKP